MTRYLTTTVMKILIAGLLLRLTKHLVSGYIAVLTVEKIK